MGSVKYDVPLIRQVHNPICLLACAAMVVSERLGRSVGISRFANGFDPNSASLEDGTEDHSGQIQLMSQWGFNCVNINPTNEEIEQVLRTCGPFILSHKSGDIPTYGVYPPDPKNDGYHAVVITGLDSTLTVGGICWINNPAGQKDFPVPLGVIVAAVIRRQADGQGRAVYYYRQ